MSKALKKIFYPNYTQGYKKCSLALHIGNHSNNKITKLWIHSFEALSKKKNYSEQTALYMAELKVTYNPILLSLNWCALHWCWHAYYLRTILHMYLGSHSLLPLWHLQTLFLTLEPHREHLCFNISHIKILKINTFPLFYFSSSTNQSVHFHKQVSW